MPNTILLEVFTDYVCPWCYLGDNRTKKLKQDYDILVQLVHFPLHPETPIEGRTLQELFGCGPEQIKAKNVQMKNLMAAYFLRSPPQMAIKKYMGIRTASQKTNHTKKSKATKTPKRAASMSSMSP